MMRVTLERGPAGYLQIGPKGRREAWLTVWWSGATISLPGDRLLCIRSPKTREYYSERNGIGIKRITKLFGWRVFVRKRFS